MIRMSDVSMEYDNGVRAVKKATLRIDEGEFVFLVGPSGSGKSTLIKLLTGEVKPTSGRIVVNNYNIGAIKKREIPYLRRTLGVVFQDFRLIEKKTVYENVAFAMRAVGEKNRAIRKRVPYVLDLVGLSEKADTRPLELSGGEQQRVAIARALVNNPRLIIADEPTGNLDPARSYELMTLFEKINELGTTILIVTHEKELVDEFEKRVIMIDNGEIVSDATGRYYADDEYYDNEYIEEQVQENIEDEPKAFEDTANATLTMLFERLNVKKTDEQPKEETSLKTKPIYDENIQNDDIKTQAAVLADDDVSANDIINQQENNENQYYADSSSEETKSDDAEFAVNQFDIDNPAENEVQIAESLNEQQINSSDEVKKPDLSRFSNRVGMNTAMMNREQPQRVKTSVGSVDASLEELIQRFEKRVSAADNKKEQAGGEIENEQKNAETEASQQ